MSDDTENVEQKGELRDEKGRWLPGQAPKGAGRPKGVKHKLSQSFLKDLAISWQEQGEDVLKRVAKDDPSTYVRVIASLVPKELITRMEVGDSVREIKDVTPEDLAVVSKVRQALAEAALEEGGAADLE